VSWKLVLVKAAGVGVGIGVGIGLVVAITVWNSSRPKAWNTKAITATYQSAQSPEFYSKPGPAAYFWYTLQNNTVRDYSVHLSGASSSLKAAARLARQGSAQVGNSPRNALTFGGVELFLPNVEPNKDIENIASGEPFFLPANQSVDVRVRWAFSPEDLKKDTSVQLVNNTLFGFVVFDEANHYQIEFPKPPSLKGEFTDADLDAPDKGDAFDRVAGCDEADKMVSLCKAKGIGPIAKSSAAYGGYEEPLPQLPRQAKGEFVPAQKVCDTAMQWQNYCRINRQNQK